MTNNNNFFLKKYKNIKNDSPNNNLEQKKEDSQKVAFEKLEIKENKDYDSLLSKRRFAALYFVVIGIENASKFIKQFSQQEVYKIIKELLNIESITDQDISFMEKNFGKIKVENLKNFKKSREYIRVLLHNSFGIEKGSKIFAECIEENKSSKNSFSFMNKLQPKVIADIISKESDAVCSVIFSFMDSNLIAKVVSLLPKKRSISILKNISRKIEIMPEVLETIIKRMKRKVEHLPNINLENKGKEKLIEILRFSDYEKASKIIDDLEKTNPDLANDLRESIFTFEDVVQIPKKSLDYALRKIKDQDIAFILKGASKELKEKLFISLTKKRREIINEEMNFLGKVKKKDVNDKRKEFVAYLRKLESQDKIVLNPDNEIYVD